MDWIKGVTVTEMRLEIDRLTEEIAHLRAEVDAKSSEICELQTELHRVRPVADQAEGLRAELSKRHGETEHLRGELADAYDEIARLREALTEIGREQSAVSATVAADKFQSIARAALASDGKGES